MTKRNQQDDSLIDRMAEMSGITDGVKGSVGDVMQSVQSQLRSIDFNETTIPDAFQNVPKMVSPRVHAWLDIAVTGYFLAVGAWCVSRGKTGAATAAFVNAGMVAGLSLVTDYEGKGKKPVSFKMHGTMDAVQAATAAMAPSLHGFAGEPEAMFFYGQAANELAVIATTDWDAGTPGRTRRGGGRRAA